MTPRTIDPPYDEPAYRSSALRAPKHPLIPLPHLMTERTGPVFGQARFEAADADLTRQHHGEPLGERIILTGRVLDSAGRAIPGQLVEIWQANTAGRYAHPAISTRRLLTPTSPGRVGA